MKPHQIIKRPLLTEKSNRLKESGGQQNADEASLRPQVAFEVHSDANKVQGCASQVWLLMARDETGSRLDIRGDSDALIVKGLVALVIAMFSGRTLAEIHGTDAQAFFAEIGLKDHLTSQRANGLASMVARIKAEAARGV